MSRQEAFLASHPGLSEALQADHRILRDMAARLAQYGSLSDRQVAFALKLAAEVSSKPAERRVPAPVAAGRQTVEGTVVSLKSYDGQFGVTLKMLVRVDTPDGSWLAWGTVPSGLDQAGVARGDVVRFDAKLALGDEPHFARFSRPTHGSVVRRATEVAA